MQQENEFIEEERIDRVIEREREEEGEAPETAEHPVPGIKHEDEPDAENIMPVEDGPGTF